jgi:hypothetical protein
MRRERRGHKPGTHSTARRSKKANANLPPILIRGGMAGVPVKPRKLGAPPKRRYDVALNVPGAELHLPALPAIRLNWRLASGLLTAFLLALLFHLWTSPNYRIDMVEVTGLKRLTDNDINTVLGLSGQPIFAAEPQHIQQALQQAFPDLKSITVKVGLPAKVLVTVDERLPVISWQQDGREQWIDAEGMAFPPRGNGGKLVIVEAKDSPSAPEPSLVKASLEKASSGARRLLSPEMVAAIEKIATQAPQDTPLLFTNDHGLGWQDPHGWNVYFGLDISNMEMKLLVYQAMVERLQKDGIQPALISVEYIHAPYYRLER